MRVAIAGVGWAGTRHVEAIRELGRKLTVDCLVDNDATFLAEKSIELDVRKTHPTVESAIADPDVDAISICLPHRHHCDVAVAAAEAGKHVLVEKPMAMTVDEATRMIKAAARCGTTLFVAENLPYSSMSRTLRAFVQEGHPIGEIVAVSVVAGFRAEQYGYPGRRAWLSTPEEGGSGQWLPNGIHTIAQVRYVFGEIQDVYLRHHHSSRVDRTDVEATLTGTLTTEAGFSITLVQSREVFLKGRLGGLILYGDRGSVRTDRDGYELFDADGQGERLEWPVSDLSDYALEMEAFVDAVSGDTWGPTTAESERRSLAVVMAGYESAEREERIRLSEAYGDL